MEARSAKKTRLRQNGDIRRATGLGVDDDLLLVVLGRGVTDLNARGVREIGEHGLDERLVLAAPGAEDRQLLALRSPCAFLKSS